MTTQTAYRQHAAPALGYFLQGTANVASTTALLEDDIFGIKSSIDQATKLEGMWLFTPGAAAAADKVRLIPEEGYDPDNGRISPDLAWSVAPDGLAYEVLNAFEPLTEFARLLNETLKRIPVVREFTFSPASPQIRRHSLAGATWILDPRWIYQVGFLTSSESRNEVDPFRRVVRGKVEKVGGVLYMEGPTFNATDVVYVKAQCRAYDFCKATGSTFGDRSGIREGTETDEAEPIEEWVTAGIAVERELRRRRQLAPVLEDQALRLQLEEALGFTDMTAKHWSAPDRTFRQAPMRWGPQR